MPRRRTISCPHCGYLQLKRDTECDRCGRLTAREKNRLVATAIYVGVVLAIVAVGYWKITQSLQGLAG